MSDTATYSSRTVVVPPGRKYPFHITAKCYVPQGELYNANGKTILLLHSTSFHKEIYEPALDELGLLARTYPMCGRVQFKEAWVVECPNHGESAVLNQAVLQRPQYQEYCRSSMLSPLIHLCLCIQSPVNDMPRLCHIFCPPKMPRIGRIFRPQATTSLVSVTRWVA